MTERASVGEHELDDLSQGNQAGSSNDVSQSAPAAPSPHIRAQEGESPTINPAPPGDAPDNDADLPGDIFSTNSAKPKESRQTATAIGTWIGSSVAIGALIVAVYYGYWSLSLQRWSALKDFKSECQSAQQLNISTPECIAALALPPTPPPVTKRLVQRFYECITFQPGCSDDPEPKPIVTSRPLFTKSKKPWWLLLTQTIGLTLFVAGLHRLRSIPPEQLREILLRRLGDRGMQVLRRTLRIFSTATWETFVFLSCFSPLYAVRFWWVFRKRLRFSSIAALTYLGGAFTAYYVYGSRLANALGRGREGIGRSWKDDERLLERQVWMRPDGVPVTIPEVVAGEEKEVGEAAVGEGWQGGARMRKHR